MSKDLPIYELKISEEDIDSFALSLVDFPAIESNFRYFNTQKIKLNFNDEKMEISGPALIPDKLIYRRDNNGFEYNTFFSVETIRKFVELFMKKNKSKFNIQHTDKFIQLNIIESYFAKKDNEFDVPENSWIITAKVLDKETWEMVKEKMLNGFSVEGLFYNELIEFSNNNIDLKTKNKMDIKTKIMEAVNKILFEEVQITGVTENVEIGDVITGTTVEEVEGVVVDISGDTAIVETEPEVGVEVEEVEIPEVEIPEVEMITKDEVNQLIAGLEQKIADLEAKLELLGETPAKFNKEVEVIQNNISTNKYSKYFQK